MSKRIVGLNHRHVMVAVAQLRAAATAEHGLCPEEYSAAALADAIRADGAVPTESEVDRLVYGVEQPSGDYDADRTLVDRFKHIDELLCSIF